MAAEETMEEVVEEDLAMEEVAAGWAATQASPRMRMRRRETASAPPCRVFFPLHCREDAMPQPDLRPFCHEDDVKD